MMASRIINFIILSLLLGTELEVVLSDWRRPSSCRKEELESTMSKCITAWKYYCECNHCSPVCLEVKGPSAETESWMYESEQGWGEKESKLTWSRKCAQDATIMWKMWCRRSEFVNSTTGKRERYKYWFLVDLDKTLRTESIEHLCQRLECPDQLLTTRTELKPPRHTTVAEETTTARTISMTLPKRERWEETNDLETKYDFPRSCSGEELSRILEKCIIVWQNYCKCAECDATCNKDEWPPREMLEWTTYDKRIELESLDGAWKWAGKCAYNATKIWRPFCYMQYEKEEKEPEHDYLFLTDLRKEYTQRFIKSLCLVSECDKFKEIEKATLQMESVVQLFETTTKSLTAASSQENTTTIIWQESSSPGQPTSVPKWAPIVIATLGAVVILMCTITVACICHRKKSSKPAKHRGACPGPALPSDVNQWKPPSSFTFFSEKPLAGSGEDIYHTITDESLPKLPPSPAFPMGTFQSQNGTRANTHVGSVQNVLYHDATPRLSTINSTQFNALRTVNTPNDQVHAYEYTEPGPLPLSPRAPPLVQPYFVTTPGEYDTLATTGSSNDHTEHQETHEESQKNYDHIQLMDRL